MINYGHSDSWNIRLSHYGSLTGSSPTNTGPSARRSTRSTARVDHGPKMPWGGAEQPVMSPAAYFGGRLRACATPWDTQRRKASSSVHTLASTTIQPFIGRLVMSNGRVPGSASSMSC